MVNVFKIIKCFVKVTYNQQMHFITILALVCEMFLISDMLISRTCFTNFRRTTILKLRNDLNTLLN